VQETSDREAVLDVGVALSLSGSADDGTAGRDFARRFRSLLPHRLWRIAQALETGDGDRALDAVLSLKVSAATLGARQMSGLAAQVEARLRAGDPAGSERAAAALSGAASRLDAELDRFLTSSCVC
jgi:HPt (histidine-containing phosphotransfer) domain-containing protein